MARKSACFGLSVLLNYPSALLPFICPDNREFTVGQTLAY